MENYIGSKFSKDTTNWEEYGKAAEWCTSTQLGYIVDKGDYYEVVEVPAPTLAELKSQKIAVLKSLLSNTDYIQSKYVDGTITEDAYAPIKTRRQEWRNAINSIQAATTLDVINAIAYSIDIPTYE